MSNRLQNLLSADYVPGMRKRRPVRWGIAALVITALVVIIGISHWTPFSSYSKTIKADFASTLHIYPHTPVRINGYDVGMVSNSQLIGDSEVQLTMTITDPQVTVHRNASAQLYYRTLLGRNVYIALDPGTSSQPELSAAIPTARTGSQVEVDQALSVLQYPARRGVQKTLDTLGQGLNAGNAPRETLARAGSALDATGQAASAVRGQNPGYDVPRLVTSGNQVFRALNASEGDLEGLIDNGNTALAVTAARASDVDSILEQGPNTLLQTEETMLRLRRTLNILNPLAQRLEPGVRDIAPALRVATPTLAALTRLVPVADPTLEQLRPALVSLGQLGRAGVPLFTGLTPTLNRTNASIIPFLDQTSPVTKLKNYEAIGPTFATVSSSASNYDDGGFMQRFQPGLKTGLTQLPVAASQCGTLFPSSVPGASAACEQIINDLDASLGAAASAPSGARR